MRFSLPIVLSVLGVAAAVALGTSALTVGVAAQAPAAQAPAAQAPAGKSPAAKTPATQPASPQPANAPPAAKPAGAAPSDPKAGGEGGDEPPQVPVAEPGKGEPGKGGAEPAMPPPVGFTRLSKVHAVYIHGERKLVAVDGRVCLNRGPLEMFACPQKTKEHESIVAVYSDAMTVHAALLAIGAKSGNPVSFNPDYKPATGSRIDIQILWTDKKTGQRQQVPAQQWIRHSRTKKQLEYNWVFGGSSFFLDEETKKQIYQAESGDLVCVSNFPTATLDLPIESSQANADLEFEAFTERIAPVGTPIRLIFSIGKP